MNLFSCLCVSLIGQRVHGLVIKKNYWTSFTGPCCRPSCRVSLRFDNGIFCANFYSGQGPFAPDNSCWCGPCFTKEGPKSFPTCKLFDKDGELLDDHLDERRFNKARPGDHLMTPFQCELCHFRNIFHLVFLYRK